VQNLADTINKLKDDTCLSAVILTGGEDLKERQTMSKDEVIEYVNILEQNICRNCFNAGADHCSD
jgi:hypothetical protein